MKKCFLSTIMALAVALSTMFSITASAVETPDANNGIPESYSISREQIAEMMDCCVDDIKDMTFYATFTDINNSNRSTYSIQIPADNESVLVDQLNVSGGTTKGNEFQIQGNRFVWVLGVANMSNAYTSITGNLYAKGAGAQTSLTVNSNNKTASSGYMNATRNTTFYVEYTVPKGVTCTVISLVGCYNN